MEFSTFLVFAAWTASMTYLTLGKERERAMLFPDYYFFAGRRLVNHAIEEKRVKNLDDCELLCYLSDSCVSLNFRKDPDNNQPGHICELNNATHLKYDSDLTTDANFYYRGSKSACDKSSHCQNNATCQSGFTLKGYRCLCPPGFEGESCETDTDECEVTPGKCHKEATCNNTDGSYVCTCKPGFIGDGRNCTDIDECSNARADQLNKCHANASCINTYGSYSCSCNPKYIEDGFNCEADPCYNYKNLSDASRKSSNKIQGYQCDDELQDGWYRFVGAAGTKMPTTRVPAFSCGTTYSGWLIRKDSPPFTEVCFSKRDTGCKKTVSISEKECGSYHIYKLYPTKCPMRYCGSD